MEDISLILGIIASMVTIIGIPLIWKQIGDLLPPKQFKINYIEHTIINNSKEAEKKKSIIADDINKMIVALINDYKKIINVKIISRCYQRRSSRKRQYKYNDKNIIDAIILKPSKNRAEKLIIRGLKLIFNQHIVDYQWNHDVKITNNIRKFVLDYFDLIINYPDDYDTFDFYFHNNDKTFHPNIKIGLDKKIKSEIFEYLHANEINCKPAELDGSYFIKVAPNYKEKIILRFIFNCTSNDMYWDEDNNFKFESDIICIFSPLAWKFGPS